MLIYNCHHLPVIQRKKKEIFTAQTYLKWRQTTPEAKKVGLGENIFIWYDPYIVGIQ